MSFGPDTLDIGQLSLKGKDRRFESGSMPDGKGDVDYDN